MSNKQMSKTKQRQAIREEIETEFQGRPATAEVVAERNSRVSVIQQTVVNISDRKNSIKTAFTLVLADYKASHSK